MKKLKNKNQIIVYNNKRIQLKEKQNKYFNLKKNKYRKNINSYLIKIFNKLNLISKTLQMRCKNKNKENKK